MSISVLIGDIHIKMICQPAACLAEAQVQSLSHQSDGIGRESAAIAVAGVLLYIEGETRMMIIVVDAEGSLVAEPHAQKISHLQDVELAKFLNIIFIDHNL